MTIHGVTRYAVPTLTAILIAGCGGDSTTTVIERTVVAPPSQTATAPVATTPSATATAPTKPAHDRCPDVRDVGPTGADPADAVNVTVDYTDCTTATRLARRFYPVWIPSGKSPGEVVTVLGFNCGEQRKTGGFTARVFCARSASAVSFDLQ